MKVLLDENLSRRLRKLLPDHQVATVAYQEWRGIRNGALLELADKNGFQVFLTADRNVPYQQSVRDRRLGVVVLSINKLSIHRDRIASISLAIENCTPGSVTLVDLGEVSGTRTF